MAVLKYYLAMSNRYEVDQPGYYYITARNTEGNLIPKGKVSNMIYVPYPTKLNDESLTIVNEFETGDGSAEAPAAIFLDNNHQIQLAVLVSNPEEDTLDFSWTEQGELIDEAKEATFDIVVEEEEAGLLDDQVRVKVFTKRNNAHTEFEKDTEGNVIDTSVYKYFRVTDKPHKFDFRIAPNNDERQIAPGIRVREEYSEDHVELPTIAVEFSNENIVNPEAAAGEQTFNFLTDTIYYRWRKAQRQGDTIDTYYQNDFPASEEEGNEFKVLEITGNTVPTIEFTPSNANDIYYCELVNVVNGENARQEDESLVDFLARVSDQIARTEYISVDY